VGRGDRVRPSDAHSGAEYGQTLVVGREDELLPIPEAAERYDVDVKRLRGAVFRGCTRDARLSDPIGSLTTDEVYAWSVERWAKRVSP
jgi:hypothetical protein